MSTKGKSRPIQERFWKFVGQNLDPGRCWVWKGSTATGKGRGGHARISDGKRPVSAAQVAWSIHRGRPWPEGLHACHHCDNPPCVNPWHIFPGTAQDNLHDAIKKGRFKFRKQARLTHCYRGHEFTPENVITRKNGDRTCRACSRITRKVRISKGAAG